MHLKRRFVEVFTYTISVRDTTVSVWDGRLDLGRV